VGVGVVVALVVLVVLGVAVLDRLVHQRQAERRTPAVVVAGLRRVRLGLVVQVL